MSLVSQNVSHAPWVIARANEIGFDLCGVIPAASLVAPEHRDEWLARGFAGEMRYLHDDRRGDPAAAFPEARSVIVCALNYNSPRPYSTEAAAGAGLDGKSRGWISRYAWGEDYHIAVEAKLAQLAGALRERFGDSAAIRHYVDTGPISERQAARLAGLGWLGKNTCLINQEAGSTLFLGVILTSLDLVASDAAPVPAPDLCGNCRLCLDACPTEALVEPYLLDASRCISYLTIELRGSIPEELRPAMGWQVFGCDICQDVCPWNRKSPRTDQPAFQPREWLEAPELSWLLSITEEDFREIFRGSPVRRAKWRGLVRNACIVAGNALAKLATRSSSGAHEDGHPEAKVLRERLASLASSGDALIAEHARWALGRDRRGPNAAPAARGL